MNRSTSETIPDKERVLGRFFRALLQKNGINAFNVKSNGDSLIIRMAFRQYVELEITPPLTIRVVPKINDPLVLAVWNSKRFIDKLSEMDKYIIHRKMHSGNNLIYIRHSAIVDGKLGGVVDFIDKTLSDSIKELMRLLDKNPNIYDLLVATDEFDK